MTSPRPEQQRPPLLLVPGLGGQPDCYDELRAVWQEPDGNARFPLTVMAFDDQQPMRHERDYLDLFARLAPREQPYAIVANSFGCQRAYHFALTSPPNLRAMVFLSGFLGNPHRGLTALGQSWLFQGWHRYPNHPTLAARTHNWQGDYAREGMARQIAQTRRPSPAVMRARVQMMRRQASRLPGLRLPCLILHARDDALLHRPASHNLSRSLPAALEKTLPGPHFLVQAEASRVAAEVERFLMGVDFS